MTGARVVGIGQRVAGDDGVGLVVLEELARRSLPEGTTLVSLKDPIDLIPLLESEDLVVLIDAVLASPAGVVLDLEPHDLSGRAAQPASSHGLGAAQAIALAHTLSPRAPSNLRVVAVTIPRPERYRVGLTPEVAAAVAEAADRVVALLGA